MRTPLLLVAMTACALCAPAPARAGLDGLQPVDFHSLSDPYVSALGERALEINADKWLHAETENFIYHYFNSFIATPVSVEAEFYYRVIARDLDRQTADWERKSHIYIFESDEDWAAFKSNASLEPWTGGIHSDGELFIQRNPKYKYKGRVLGHEVVHLVVDRFLPGSLPLWLEEGYAEYASMIAYAAFLRARNYSAKPVARAVDAAAYINLSDLFGRRSYPSDPAEVGAFYDQSHRLVRFLRGRDKQAFLGFLEDMAGGARTESALREHFGIGQLDMDEFEEEFRAYAVAE